MPALENGTERVTGWLFLQVHQAIEPQAEQRSCGRLCACLPCCHPHWSRHSESPFDTDIPDCLYCKRALIL